MSELEPGMVLAVFQEMLGWIFWPWVVLAVVATLACIYVLVRDRGIVAHRLVWSEVLGVFGGFIAVFIMFSVTSSGFRDFGGPIDWLLAIGIFGFGLFGMAIGAYAAFGLIGGRPERKAEG